MKHLIYNSMRHLFILLTLMLSFNRLYAQSVRDSIGQEEGVFLNQIAAELHINFDFSHKKVAFYTGPGAGARSDKERYFLECQDIKNNYPQSIAPMTMIYVFDSDEKKKTNGYDAVIVYGSVKQFPPKKTLVKRLHR